MYLGGVVDDAGLGLGDWGLGVSGEQHQVIEVLLESGLVGVQGLLASVLASVVDGDTDGSGEVGAQASSSDFLEGETYMGGKVPLPVFCL